MILSLTIPLSWMKKIAIQQAWNVSAKKKPHPCIQSEQFIKLQHLK